MQRNKRGVPQWQARWVTLHDELHLLEVLLEAITPLPEYTNEYWALSADVITFSQELQDAYERELATGGPTGDDEAYLRIRGRLRQLQARAQTLSLENEVE